MIKILCLTYWREQYMSYRQHLGTLNWLKKYEDVEYNCYSRKYFEGKKDYQFDELIEKHQPDVLIGYSGIEFHGKPLFGDFKGLKVCIEPDYHNFKGKEWWFDQQFDVVALRNGNNPVHFNVPTFWWPWSADPAEFFADDRDRRRIIGFAGSSVHELYNIRRKARDILLRAKLLEDKKKLLMAQECRDGLWKGPWSDQGKYQEYLKSVVAILTSTENRGPFAKTFEAMASKTAVLTSPVINNDLLFGYPFCYTEYSRNCLDIVPQAKKLLFDDDYRNEMIENAYKVFMEKHTTEKRIDELLINIKRQLEGKSLIKLWGF